jgi:MFS family permease
MHFDAPPTSLQTSSPAQRWWRELTRYHWFVLIVAALAWMADCMDQQLFNIARQSAMQELLRPEPGVAADDGLVKERGGFATSIFLIGWGTGGLIFGFVGDMIGRARTMLITILLYSLFTGLSALSQSFWQFGLFRFLTGLGVGGEFAVGVSLVAEVMPDRARPFALGLLQALSALGNIAAALIAMAMGQLAKQEWIDSPWRAMFVVGAVPALLIVFVMRRLKEPEKWTKAASEASLRDRFTAYYAELFSNPRWTRNAVIGLLLASSGIIGLWAIGFFSFDLQQSVFDEQHVIARGLDPREEVAQKWFWAGMTSITFNIGAACGIYAFSYVTHYLGRRPTFAISFVLAMLSTAFVFWQFDGVGDIFWMIPMMGFCLLGLFGGYAIYFPELFPTRLRSSGTSVCYNGARFVAAFGTSALGLLTNRVYDGYPGTLPFRYAGITMCAVFIVGLLVLPFAPETKGKPLPE